MIIKKFKYFDVAVIFDPIDYFISKDKIFFFFRNNKNVKDWLNLRVPT